MADTPITEFSVLTNPQPEDSLHAIDDSEVVGPKNKELGFGTFLSTYNISAREIAAGLSNDDLDFKEDPGVVLRYGDNPTPGTTDMTATIRTADSTGHPVYLPADIYLVSSLIVLSDGAFIFGDGAATEIRFDNAAYPSAEGIFSTVAANGTAGRAEYRWGDNLTIKSNVIIRDLKFNLNRTGLSSGDATASNAFCLRFEDCKDSGAYNCIFMDNMTANKNIYQCINIIRSDNVTIKEGIFDQISGVLAQDTDHTNIILNQFTGSLGSAIDLAVGTYAHVAENRVIDGTTNSVSSIGVNCAYSTIKENRVTKPNLTGITLGEQTLDFYGLDPICDHSVCEGNIIVGDGGAAKIGILLQAANHTNVIGNNISDIGVTGLGATVDLTAGAISARGAAGDNRGLTITGNVCINVNRGINLGRNGYSVVADNVIELWAVLVGSHTAAGNAAVLEDSTQSWPTNALIGYTLTNTTDGSSTTVTANTATTATGVLSGGTDDDWDTNDHYHLRLSGTANFQEGINVFTSVTPDDGFMTITGNSILGGEVGVFVQGDNANVSDNAITKTSNFPIRIEDHDSIASANRINECDREVSLFMVKSAIAIGNLFKHSISGLVDRAIRVTGDDTSALVAWETTSVKDNINIGATDDILYTDVFNAPSTATTINPKVYANTFVTALDDTGTPSVLNGSLFDTGGTTAITDFDDGVIGQTIKLISSHSVTITDGSPIVLSGGVNFNMVAGDTLSLKMFDDQIWEETARKQVTTLETYTPTNVSTDRSFDANAAVTGTGIDVADAGPANVALLSDHDALVAVVQEQADVIGTLIADLQARNEIQ